MAKIETTLLEKKLIATYTAEVYFGVPDNFSFIPGQYITVTLPSLADLEMREQFRDFSVSSPPSLKGRVRVTFRVSESIFKKTLLETPNIGVVLEGPAGVFTLPPASDQRIIAIAGGIGVTPFMSMLGENPKAFELIFYNNNPQAAPYLSELRTLLGGKLHDYYVPAVKSHLQSLNNDGPPAFWYIAGPPAMVANVRQLLKTLKIDDTMIRTEEFSGYE